MEKYGLPRLVRVLGRSFGGLTIVSCNGKNKIPHYAAVCRAFDVPTMVVFDLDGSDEAETENARVIDATASVSVWKFPTSFEELLGVGKKAQHKASEALKQVDTLKRAAAVPKEIKTAIAAIADWCEG